MLSLDRWTFHLIFVLLSFNLNVDAFMAVAIRTRSNVVPLFTGGRNKNGLKSKRKRYALAHRNWHPSKESSCFAVKHVMEKAKTRRSVAVADGPGYPRAVRSALHHSKFAPRLRGR